MAKSPETVSIDQLDKDQMKTVSNVANLIDKFAKPVMQCAIESTACNIYICTIHMHIYNNVLNNVYSFQISSCHTTNYPRCASRTVCAISPRVTLRTLRLVTIF